MCSVNSTGDLTEEGHYQVSLTLEGSSEPAIGTTDLFVVNPTPKTFKPMRVGIVGLPNFLSSFIPDVPNITTQGFTPGVKYDALVVGGPSLTQNSFGTTDPIKGTKDPALYQSQLWGGPNQLGFYIDGLPAGTAQVTLKFAEIFWTAPGQRVFDVAINGQTVLRHFDMLAEAGGKDIAIDKTFTIPVVNCVVTISAPATESDSCTGRRRHTHCCRLRREPIGYDLRIASEPRRSSFRASDICAPNPRSAASARRQYFEQSNRIVVRYHRSGSRLRP